jgi:hypothetical protein
VTRRNKILIQCRVTGFALRPDTTWNYFKKTFIP